MGYLFRINKVATGTNNTIVDWSNTPRSTYDYGFVNRIEDSTTTQSEITSIPSPFARIELVKEAFRKVVGESLNVLTVQQVKNRLHGDTIYHKMVSDSLDVGQIFFNYPSMKDRVEIKVWNKNHIDELLKSTNPSHQIYGKALKMFFDQDAKGSDPYNFGKMKNIYILKYKGPNHKPMHIIGATSPATLFFSTANDEKGISRYLCFGGDYAFDKKYASLDQRDPEYLKYLFTLRYSILNFSIDFSEVDSYLDAVYYVLDDNLKAEIDDIQTSCANMVNGVKSFIDSTYEPLNVAVASTVDQVVEVNGFPLHYKEVNLQGNTDFEIQATKTIAGGKTPLVLPVNTSSLYDNLEYYGCKFGRSFNIPYYDAKALASRTLPGINIQHPYLTISDFLDDKIIKLPSDINSEDYFNGNFTSNNAEKEGYLLPVTKMFFDYFTAEDLKGTTPSGKHFIDIKKLASGIEVVLRIPIAKGDVEYKRIYTLDVKADKQNNKGAIVLAPEDFTIGVFPPVKFRNEADAQYRIAILSDFNLNKECSCSCHNEVDSFFVPDYVVRNVDIEDDIRSKVYILENKTFDCAMISILTDQPGKELRATGLMLPKFKQRMGTANLTFAIDLGTSNTHIEYTSGANRMPEPFSYSQDNPLFSMICKPSGIIRMHARGEFLPEAIGNDAQCHFPTRTVLSIDRNNSGINESGMGAYVALGNASPAFMYNKADIGTRYNDYIPNLKWSQLNHDNEERIRCYIESLFLMIRTKVIQEGASLTQTQIKWFYPISMSNNKRGLFQRVWTAAYQKYFNPTGQPVAITESIAPYSFFQKTRADVTNIVTIDIGGGTTDIVVADTNDVKLITSMRFAADAIFGNSLVAVQNGPLNGIIKQFKDEYIINLKGMGDLQKMLIEKTANNFGNSSEVASFLFSLEENELVRQNHLEETLSFNETLMKDSSQKIVFYIFFTSIMYHIAHLMKAKGLNPPTNIAFSGNGSKVISVLSTVQSSLELLTTKIFSLIYESDIKDINLIINSKNPKEATCKGGLFLTQVPNDISRVKSVLLGTSKTCLVDGQKYDEVASFYDDIVKEVKTFMDFIALRIPRSISLSGEFGIDQRSLQLAVNCFNKDLRTYIEKGVNLKLDSKDVSKYDVIEESLFFYPIIGVINDLSEQIYTTSSQLNLKMAMQNK